MAYTPYGQYYDENAGYNTGVAGGTPTDQFSQSPYQTDTSYAGGPGGFNEQGYWQNAGNPYGANPNSYGYAPPNGNTGVSGYGPGGRPQPWNAGAPNASAPGGTPTTRDQIMQWFVNFGQQNGGDPSAVNDPGYWTNVAMEKIAKGADPMETLKYLGGRITGGSGGGGGGGMGGSYTPMNPFQFERASFDRFATPSMQTPGAFHYNGPGLTTPGAFQFAGITPRQAQGPAQAPPKPQPPPSGLPPDPGPPPFEGAGYIASGPNAGAWVPKDSALYQDYAAQATQGDAAAQQQYQQDLASWNQQYGDQATASGAHGGGSIGPAGQSGKAPAQGPGGSGGAENNGIGQRGLMSGQLPGGSGGSGADGPGNYATAETNAQGFPMAPSRQSPLAGFDPRQMPQMGANAQAPGPGPGGGSSGDARTGDVATWGNPTAPQPGSAPWANIDRNLAPTVGNTIGPGGSSDLNAPGGGSVGPAGAAQNAMKPGAVPDGGGGGAQGDGTSALGRPMAGPGGYPGGGPGGSYPGMPRPDASRENWGGQLSMSQPAFRAQIGGPQGSSVPTIDAQGLTLPTYQGSEQFYGANPYGSFNRSGDISAGNPFAFSRLRTPSTYQPGQFTAPTAADAQNDPGYQFRLQQGQRALEQSAVARGNLLSTGTARALTDYGQQAGSQEYQNVYGRRFGEFQQREGEAANAAAFNANTQMAAQAQQYGQAANTYGMNQNARMTAQQQSYQNALAGYQANANTYGMNYNNAFQASEARNANNRADYALNAQTQLGAENQAFGQALQAYGVNAQVPLQYQQQQWQQQYQPWQQNAANQLSANTANLQANLSTNALNASQQQAEYNANYNNAWNAYQSQVQQGQYAAGLGYQYAGLGLQAQNQAFNQNATSYQMNQNTLWGNQDRAWNQQYQLAQLGYGADQGLNQYGQGYANNAGNLYTGMGNAQAAGRVGQANAWNNAYGQIANAATNAYGQSQANRRWYAPQG